MTLKQMRAKHGSPEEFAKAAEKAYCDLFITFKEKETGIEKYNLEWSLQEAREALQGLLDEPFGCSLCHSGKVINPTKGHQPDCPFEIARAVLQNANGQPTAGE